MRRDIPPILSHELFYYSNTNQTSSGKLHGQERHDHFGYCYGWAINETIGTIFITDNIYGVDRNLCCLAMAGNCGVPVNWLNGATWMGVEHVHGKNVDHLYSWEHEYWSESDGIRNGLR